MKEAGLIPDLKSHKSQYDVKDFMQKQMACTGKDQPHHMNFSTLRKCQPCPLRSQVRIAEDRIRFKLHDLKLQSEAQTDQINAVSDYLLHNPLKRAAINTKDEQIDQLKDRIAFLYQDLHENKQRAARLANRE